MFALWGVVLAVNSAAISYTGGYLYNAPIVEQETIPVVNNSLIGNATPKARSDTENHSNPPHEAVLRAIRASFGDYLAPYMYQLALCESGLKQWNKDGTVVKSPTEDYGILQINEIWGQKALDLNLDYKNSWEDNIQLAKVIYDTQGLGAWTCKRVL